MDKQQLIDILNNSPSVRLIKSHSVEFVITFLSDVFAEKSAVSSEKLHLLLENRLDNLDEDLEEDTVNDRIETNEDKAKRLIKEWADKGFLTNYQSESGEIIYELSSYTSKAIDWVSGLKKEDYIGTESKFKAIFSQLKELVEFTNEDREKRLEILKDRKLEIEQQIEKLEAGEDIKVFEEYEIVPRYNSLNKLAKELLSDFKEVDDNFKDINKQIHQRQIDNLQKKEILHYIFDAYSELKESSQGKSFYAFWEFLLSKELQNEWDELTQTLYDTLGEKQIETQDVFLKELKQHLFEAGKKVTKAIDKMSEKLSRVIRENEVNDSEHTKNVINDIKKLLIEASNRKETLDVSFELEGDFDIFLPLERSLTTQQTQNYEYRDKPSNAQVEIDDLSRMEKLYNPYHVDRKILRQRIKDALAESSQTTLAEVIEKNNGITKGLSEILGYISIVKEFKNTINHSGTQKIVFDKESNKSIEIPEIIIVR